MHHTQVELLHRISTQPPYFSSHRIFSAVFARCHAMLRDTDRADGPAAGGELAEAIGALSYADRAFLIRSPPVRVLIERLGAAGRAVDGGASYRRLSALLDDAALGAAEPDWVRRWRSAGYGTTITLTEPYPFIVTLWSERDEHGRRWSESSAIRKLCGDLFGRREGLRLLSPAEHHATMIVDALELLRKIDPVVLPEIALNIRHVCIVGRDDAGGAERSESMPVSFSSRELPGCCFVSERAFASLPLLAEQLYHEALHLKFDELLRVAPIYREGYPASMEPSFRCPWHGRGMAHALWPYDRAFAAFHVYVHLHILHATALEKGDWSVRRLRVAAEKGAILRSWIDDHCSIAMTPTGEDLHARLRALFDASRAAL